MTPQEQEQLLGELEERVDRLRVLYDQYFLGFEKLEPTIPRKDVDRRLAMLRKENIRNTALRFRFNVVNQKYNTYSMYWTRICRQIEEGTFKRHLQKAKKILEAGPGKREVDLSIDIDMEDFDSMDVDALLAEADASVDKYASGPHDTVPPGSAPSAEMPHVHRAANALFTPTPGTSFVVTKRTREVLDDEIPPSEEHPISVPLGPTAAPIGQRSSTSGAASARPSQGSQPAQARPASSGFGTPAAAAPPGQKKLIRRKDGTVGPLDPGRASSPDLSRASSPDLSRASSPPMPTSSQRLPADPASASRVAPPAAASNPRVPAAAPSGSTPKVALPAMPGSAPRIQPIGGAPRVAGPPPSTPNVPAAPQSTPKVALPAMPGRAPGAPPSTPGQPAASSGRLPAIPPGPAAGRIPTGATPADGAPSQGRLPAAAPPAIRPSSGRLPLPPPSSPRPPTPSDPGDGTSPPRPKIRPVLPSQTKKDEG